MKLAKRSIALLLAFMLIFGCFPNSVFATESTATITVGSLAEVTVGETVTVPVTISDNPGFTDAYLKIGYNADALELQGVSANLSGIRAELGNDGIVDLIAQDCGADVTGNGKLFTMTFRAVKAGNADVSLSCKDNDAGNITNAEAEAVPMSFEKGRVTVKAAGSCINVNESILPDGGWTMTVGDNKTIDLSKLFTDVDGHTLVYDFNVTDSMGQEYNSSQTHMSTNPATPDVLTFSTRDADSYIITVSATCKETGEKKEATISATVKAAKDGLPVQYGYEQTDKDEVKVFVTVSSDGIPLKGNDSDNTILSHLEITVPYFDLADYSLSDFYRYKSDDSGSYVGDGVVIERPTAMHLFIYLIQRYYMGLPEEYCGPGGGDGIDYQNMTTNPVYYYEEKNDNDMVLNMYGGKAYKDEGVALSYTGGGAQSTYMQWVWGHDENLMYYRNHAYPLQSPGWGATADYILLSDGDTIDMAMFTNWDFYNQGSFCTYVNRNTESVDDEINRNFTDVNYRPDTAFSATVGEDMILSAVKFGTQAVAEGGIDDFLPIKGDEYASDLCTKLYDEDWKEVTDDATATFEDDLQGHYTLNFKKAGTYYLLGLDDSAGTKDACVAPATAKIVVTEAKPTHEHSLTKHEANDATCAEAGNKAYWSCDACGKFFSDAEGTKEISENSWVTSKLTHVDENKDKHCDICNEFINHAPVIKEEIKDVEASVVVGEAYLLRDLQTGMIFEDPDGDTLAIAGGGAGNAESGTNVYYNRSTDGGETWGEELYFTSALFGGTTISLTETTPGKYMYRFYAKDGYGGDSRGENKNNYWTLTLNYDTAENIDFDINFFIGQDQNYKTNGNIYPIIKLWKSDGNSKKVGDEITFKDDSNVVVDGYNMMYAKVKGGWYIYEGYGWNTETKNYDIPLGGMQIKLPADSNVDGASAGGTDIYLRLMTIHNDSKKADETYFGKDDYTVRVTCPIMKCDAVMGNAYKDGNYTKYPVLFYAGGNSCLFNYYLNPRDTENYIFNQQINQTLSAAKTVQSKSAKIGAVVKLEVTVPQSADFGLYFQYNNYYTAEQLPISDWINNENGTKSATYKVSKSNSNYTWRMTDTTGTYVTKAGWLPNITADTEKDFRFDVAYTDKLSHDFGKIGTTTINRDEADLQVFADPTGAIEIGNETKRIRAYRMWQLINTDAGNIMIEPDYTWTKISGNASVSFVDDSVEIDGTQVDSGNGYHNWADIKANGGTSIFAVYYDAIDLDTSNNSTHAGFYPATNPDRVSFMAVADELGNAKAEIKFNEGFETNSRQSEWDYIYDTWYYLETEETPELTFTTKDAVKVEYAYGTTNGSTMKSTVSAFSIVNAENGNYSVPLAVFNHEANNYGGTVIIRMTDADGKYSYQLVKISRMSIHVENTTYPGEAIMPGNIAKITFDGLYRSINKISGIFNPATFYLRYTVDGKEINGKLGQYMQMDKSTIEIEIPDDVAFADGESTTTVKATNGYVYGSMYSASNPFGAMYMMTDNGVGTNFNAVSVAFAFQKMADIEIPVKKMPTTDVTVTVTNTDDATVVVTGADGKALTPDNGVYTLNYGTFNYTVTATGFIKEMGSFTVGGADNGTKTVSITLLETDEKTWNGSSVSEPSKDKNGVYQIGTGAELAWFAAQVNSGAGANYNAVLTADIELAYFSWTPIGTSKKVYNGTFDGNGHYIYRLYINNAADYQGLFGYIGETGVVQNLGVTGLVTGKQYTAGIAGYVVAGGQVLNCVNKADVTGTKNVGGVAGFVGSNTAVVRNCYNTGKITGSGQCVGGVSGGVSQSNVNGTIENCYNIGIVNSGSGGYCGSVAGGGNVADQTVNNYYLENTYTGTGSNCNKVGTAKTKTEMKTLANTLGSAFLKDFNDKNGGYPVLSWEHSHSLTEHAKNDATCTEAGNTAYWSCECGKYFSDAEGTTEIQVNSWIISKKGQTPVTPATPVTPVTPYTGDYTKEEDSEKWTTPEDKGSVPTVTKGADGSVTAQAAAEVKVTGGTAKATVDSKTATELVKQAKDNKATEVKLEVKAADTKNAKAIQAELPKSALSDIAGKTDAALVLATPQGEVKLDNKVLDEIAKAAAGTNVTIEIKAATPTAEQENTIGKSAQVIELTITSGSKTIGEFNGGTATFASELPKSLDGKRTAAVCIKADGTLEVLPSKVIEVSGKKHIEFTTSHFSTFAIVDADEAGISEEQITQAEKKNEKLIAGVNATKMTAKSSITKNSKGKKAIKISWTQSKGYKVDYYEVWKSTKKNSGYKKLYTTADSKKKSLVTSKNLKKGKTYYFKVRGVRMIEGKKYYTNWSSKVSKTYK